MPALTPDDATPLERWRLIGAVLLLVVGLAQFAWSTATHGFDPVSFILLLVSISVSTKLILAWTGVTIGIAAGVLLILGFVVVIYYLPFLLIWGQMSYPIRVFFVEMPAVHPGFCGTSFSTPGLWTALSSPSHGSAISNWFSSDPRCASIARPRMLWGVGMFAFLNGFWQQNKDKR
jgi:hypothetical protein